MRCRRGSRSSSRCLSRCPSLPLRHPGHRLSPSVRSKCLLRSRSIRAIRTPIRCWRLIRSLPAPRRKGAGWTTTGATRITLGQRRNDLQSVQALWCSGERDHEGQRHHRCLQCGQRAAVADSGLCVFAAGAGVRAGQQSEDTGVQFRNRFASAKSSMTGFRIRHLRRVAMSPCCRAHPSLRSPRTSRHRTRRSPVLPPTPGSFRCRRGLCRQGRRHAEQDCAEPRCQRRCAEGCQQAGGLQYPDRAGTYYPWNWCSRA
jgi:hypothetical protein